MKVFFALLAIVVAQASAGTINNIGGDISKVAVAGHEAIQNIINRIENAGDGAYPEPMPVEEIEELKHKHKHHHHRELEVEDINRDNINGIFVEPQPFEEEAEELKHKHKHHKHHRRDFEDISVESAEFPFEEIHPDTGFDFNGVFVEPQPFVEEAEEQKHKHKHHKHHRLSFDGTSDFSNGINFNVKFERPQPIVEDAEEQKHKHHKHHIADFIDQIYNIQNEVNQIRDDIHDAINTAHELVNNVHNVIHPSGVPESKNLVSDGATIIPELAHMSEEVLKAIQNLVNNLAATQSLMADDVEADFL